MWPQAEFPKIHKVELHDLLLFCPTQNGRMEIILDRLRKKRDDMKGYHESIISSFIGLRMSK
jgi:hypothetical protein